MTTPAAPAGYTRLIMKSKMGVGRDFRALDPETEAERYVVDGKLGLRPQADILDASGAVVALARGELLSFPKRITVTDAQGQPVAYLHARPFSFVRDKIDISLAAGGELTLEGNLIEKDYTMRDAAGSVVLQITQKWLTVRDRYTLDVAEGFDPAIALAIAWSIDRWVERD